MRFQNGPILSTLCGFLLWNDTDFKAIISYSILRLFTCFEITSTYSHCNKNDIEYMVFRSPKLLLSGSLGDKQPRILIVKEYERTPYQYYSLYSVILNEIFHLVQRFYHILTFFGVALHLNKIFPEAFTKILLLLVYSLVPALCGVYSIIAVCIFEHSLLYGHWLYFTIVKILFLNSTKSFFLRNI